MIRRTFGLSMWTTLTRLLLAMVCSPFPFAAASDAGKPVAPHGAEPACLLVCGGAEVFLIDLASDEPAKKRWSWRAADREDLPAAMRGLFKSTDECKPLPPAGDVRRILITSSGGGCAAVEYPSGKVLWHARVGNAHSIELLPRDRVVVAGSVHADGNRLAVFEMSKPGQPAIFETPLISGHGVVWDAGRERLWALGLKVLHCYKLEAWDTDQPKLALDKEYDLPDAGGHDLQAVPESNDLVISTHEHVHLFDRDRRTFRPHPQLADRPDVKCVSIHPKTARTVWLHGEPEHWWTDTLRFLNPEKPDLRLPGERLYKARWLTDPALGP